ncbi:MAG: hypothetical protein HY718_16855, partial [Planctomycetes bacterium]|nr:hypothetical protein [Planctomycetota bacterium]
MAAPGIIIHQIFPFGAFGPRQWSESELRRLMRWLKTLGYADVLFIPWGIYRAEDGPLTILEQGALYQSGLMAAPAFEPGQLYAPEDPFLGTRDGLRRAETLRITARAAREFGLRPWLALMTTLGAPGFTREHPELAAVNGIDLFNEGVGLCPSQPAARQHLLDLYEQQVRYFDAAAGFVLWQRDPGGCRCDRCMPQARMMGDLGNAFLAMIRRHRREEPVAFSAWHVNLAEVPDLARTLDPCLLIFESPRIHAADVSLDIFEERVKAWQVQGRQVESWLEVQENPTSLLPSVYPERMAEAVRRIQRLELARVWVSATQNPYLFPLHLWLTPRLWAEPADAGRLTAKFLRSTYGDYAVESGLDYAQATERAFDLTQALSTRAAGFLNLFVVTSP